MIKLEVLKDITGHADVFDCLLPVRRTDNGQEGLLLCSHCCRFPKELVNKATWLEGCFTPNQWKDDPRLLLGNHPNKATIWEVEIEEEGNVNITLSVRQNDGDVNDPDDVDQYGEMRLDIEFPPPLHLYEGEISNYIEPWLYRFIPTLWNRLSIGRATEDTLCAFFSTLAEILRQGRITLRQSRMVWSALRNFGFVDGSYEVNWISDVTRHPDLEEYINYTHVVRNNPSEGLYTPVRVLEVHSDSNSRMRYQVVTQEAFVHGATGYHIGVSIKLYDQFTSHDDMSTDNTVEVLNVLSDAPELGFWKAVSTEVLHFGEQCTTVVQNEALQGYWKAVNI